MSLRFGRQVSRAYGAWAHRLLALLACLVLAACCLAAPAQARAIKLVAYGDSLMAGYDLPEADGFPAKLEAALRRQGYDVTVVNAGVSGDTTTDGLARLDWTLGDGADAVILELGANDMLRGIDPKITKENLGKMLDGLKAKHIKVLLAGMHASPTLGRDYDTRFDAIYPALAKADGVPLYPFFLEGIIGDRALHLRDQMHPTAKGVETIVQGILPSVDKLLDGLQAKS